MTELSPQQRATLALWLILQQPQTTRQIAERCDLTMDGARAMLNKMGGVVPLSYERRRWCLMEGAETDNP